MGDLSHPLPQPRESSQPLLALGLAWLWPGAGHFYLHRWRRGALFMGLVAVSLAIGCALDGRLDTVVGGQPLSLLRTLGAMGLGLPYAILRWLIGYQDNIVAPGFEYGSAFTLTAGLMNWLLVLDCWDISTGRKD